MKLKDVKTGNTLNGKGVEQHFDFIKYPNPKYMRAIEAVNSQDIEKLMAALLKMRQEDPTWLVEQSKVTSDYCKRTRRIPLAHFEVAFGE